VHTGQLFNFQGADLNPPGFPFSAPDIKVGKNKHGEPIQPFTHPPVNNA